MFVLERKAQKLSGCFTYVKKPINRIADLAELLDSLVEEDIQAVPKKSLKYAGERGWVLRPGFEHAVYIVKAQGERRLTGIVLSDLD